MAELAGYKTLQFHVGGLFDCRATESSIHLVRSMKGGGTPGPTLCGIERFGPDAPGWSVGGGVSGEWKACDDCKTEVEPNLPINGMHEAVFRG